MVLPVMVKVAGVMVTEFGEVAAVAPATKGELVAM